MFNNIDGKATSSDTMSDTVSKKFVYQKILANDNAIGTLCNIEKTKVHQATLMMQIFVTIWGYGVLRTISYTFIWKKKNADCSK